MDIVSGIAIFFIIWWTALFIVLPFNMQRDETGKPNDPHMKKKFLYTTILSIVIWTMVYYLIEMKIVDFRALAEQMALR